MKYTTQYLHWKFENKAKTLTTAVAVAAVAVVATTAMMAAAAAAAAMVAVAARQSKRKEKSCATKNHPLNCHSIQSKWIWVFEWFWRKIKPSNVDKYFFFFSFVEKRNQINWVLFIRIWLMVKCVKKKLLLNDPTKLLCSTLKIRFTQSERPKWRTHSFFSSLVFYGRIFVLNFSLWRGVHTIFEKKQQKFTSAGCMLMMMWWWKSPSKVFIK